MERVVTKFDSHNEASSADWRYYLSLTPQQRLDIRLNLSRPTRTRRRKLQKHVRESIDLLNSASAIDATTDLD